MNFRGIKRVCVSVNPPAGKPDPYSDRLRADYRAAFKNWVLQVDRLRILPISNVESSAMKAAVAQADAAELLYRASRDRLTESMKSAQ